MIAYLRDETGADAVEELLNDEEDCLAHAVNLCEVYYDFIRSEDEHTANEAIEDLKSSGVIPRGDIDEEFWQEVGRYKGNIRRVSLADCFAIALANRVEGELATSDHGEFDPIAAQNNLPHKVHQVVCTSAPPSSEAGERLFRARGEGRSGLAGGD